MAPLHDHLAPLTTWSGAVPSWASHKTFSKMNTSMSAPPAVASRVVDLVRWFCIWVEDANLRHMTECLWFLYHKMMGEYTESEGYTQTRSLYAEHYHLIVAPIYDIVALSMSSNVDHPPERQNYDDFNEFFWSQNCLKFRYSITDGLSMRFSSGCKEKTDQNNWRTRTEKQKRQFH